MNHDRSAAQAGEPGPANASPDVNASEHYGDEQTSPHSQARRGRRRNRRRSRRSRDNPNFQRLAFITDLLRGLDAIVFAELSALYYMECSLLRFLLRAVVQAFYISPKEESFRLLLNLNVVHVSVVAMTGFWCMLLHLIGPLPQGHDYDRGYMHGGAFIDFVGQKPPTYRTYYVLADLLLMGLQYFMLTLHVEREQLRTSLKTFRPLTPTPPIQRARTVEEADVEEQGVRGAVPDELDGIELQPLRSLASTGSSDNSEPSSSSGGEPERSQLSDILRSGNAVIGEYHIVHSMRVAATETENTAAQSLQLIGYRTTMAAIQARRAGNALPSRGQVT